MSEGVRDLMRATGTFDPERGCFATHAGYWIDHSMHLAIHGWPMVRITVHGLRGLRRFEAAARELGGPPAARRNRKPS